MAEQLELFPETPKQDKPVDQDKVDKARAKAAENQEYADKRVKSSPLIQQAEVAKARAILAGGKGGGGAGGSDAMPKTGLNKKPEFKKGGKVSVASSRADGCCVKGKTKGRYL